MYFFISLKIFSAHQQGSKTTNKERVIETKNREKIVEEGKKTNDKRES